MAAWKARLWAGCLVEKLAAQRAASSDYQKAEHWAARWVDNLVDQKVDWKAHPKAALRACQWVAHWVFLRVEH